MWFQDGRIVRGRENMTSVTEKMNLTPFENSVTIVLQMYRSRKSFSNDVSIFVFNKSHPFSGLGTTNFFWSEHIQNKEKIS